MRKKIIRHLSRGDGASTDKLARLSQDDLALFKVKSASEFVALLTSCMQHMIDYRERIAIERGFNIEQRLSEGLYPRIVSGHGDKPISQRTAQRHLDKAEDTLVRLVDTVQAVHEGVNPQKVPVHTEELLFQSQLRIKELEDFLRKLLKSRHVAASTKDAIRKHV